MSSLNAFSLRSDQLASMAPQAEQFFTPGEPTAVSDSATL
jgi:hypothetical protein